MKPSRSFKGFEGRLQGLKGTLRALKSKQKVGFKPFKRELKGGFKELEGEGGEGGGVLREEALQGGFKGFEGRL